MSLEKTIFPERAPQTVRDTLEFIHKEMEGRGLSRHHIRNALVVPDFGRATGNVDSVTPMETYEERIKKQAADEGYPQEVSEKWIQCSDPDAIKKYNKLVNELNLDLDRIKKEKDVKSVSTFVEKVLELLEEYNA